MSLVYKIQNSKELKEKLQGAKRLNLPDFVKPEDIPVGGGITGIVVKIIGNFVTSRKDMDKSRNMILRPDDTPPREDGSPVELTFPVTGTIGQALLQFGPDPKAIEGKHIAIIRGPDQTDKKFKKKMFMFDVFELDGFAPKG